MLVFKLPEGFDAPEGYPYGFLLLKPAPALEFVFPIGGILLLLRLLMPGPLDTRPALLSLPYPEDDCLPLLIMAP